MIGQLIPEASFTRIEEDVRRFWRRHNVPATFHACRQDGSPYVLLQQPLVAAGASSADQVRLLAAVDSLGRYHAMQGQAVEQRAGWVCHGLPVEVAVERSLGPDVTTYDLAGFNAACHQAALEGVQQGEALAERMAVWPGPGSTFLSLEPHAVGLVWRALRRLWEGGRLKNERRIARVCPRCATPLSSAEASRRTTEVEVRSVWLRLPWDGEPGAYLLAWTPLPWTLVGMVGLAAHPEAVYALVELPADGHATAQPSRLLLAESALHRLRMADRPIVRRLSGRSLRGSRYHPPFTFLPAGARSGYVLVSERVPLDQGTGLWPVTPAFDPLSLTLAQSHDLPVPELLDDWGGLGDDVMPWRGLSPLDAEPLLVEDLQARGLLWEAQVQRAPRALCPYCETPLLPQARFVWLVETGSGPWIVSRDRAWGVPLPLWVCEGCAEKLCLAGLDDLAHRTGLPTSQIDPHRPAVDRLTFPCQRCGGTMRRVTDVVDAAFEAAVLSWPGPSQSGPANLAVGLRDRHLGWSGDLAEIAALLWGALAWEQVAVLPEAESEPAFDLERDFPADALRWAAYTGMTPAQAEREFLRPLRRLAMSLLGLHEQATEEPTSPDRLWEGLEGSEAGDLLDRWSLARTHQAVGAVAQALEAGEPHRAAQELGALVAGLADWYAPRRAGAGRRVLELLSRVLAPFIPHLAEAIHRQCIGPAASSVHLAPWPSLHLSADDSALLVEMARVQRLTALGQDARAQGGVDPDRWLRQAIVSLLPGNSEQLAELDPFAELLAEVLGVSRVQFSPGVAGQIEWRLTLEPARHVERKPAPAEIEAALADLDAEESAHLAAQLWNGLSVGLSVGERAVTLLPDEVRIVARPQPGWAAAADAAYLILLDVG